MMITSIKLITLFFFTDHTGYSDLELFSRSQESEQNKDSYDLICSSAFASSERLLFLLSTCILFQFDNDSG